MASEAPQTEARGAQRRETQATSTLRTTGTEPRDVVVHDISRTGVRFSCDCAVAAGDEVSIGLAGVGAIRAVVAWVSEGQCGCTFVEPIDDAEVANAFSAQTVVAWTAATRAAPELPPLPPLAPTLREQVDDLYTRDNQWRLPADVWAFGAALGIAGLAAWSLLR